MNAAASVVGAVTGGALFGKLPAHGDFVSRGFAADERERIDRWLSRSVADARAVHGGLFELRFDGAIPWRCTGPGVSGAIAASQDAVGRRFPILLLTGDPDAAARCEELLYTAIGERWHADRLAQEGGPAPSASPNRWWLAGVDDAAAISGAYPPDLLAAMLGTEVKA